MPKISLTDFIEISSKSGTPKVTKVSQVKNRASYHPAKDFYKPLREAFIEHFQNEHPKSLLKDTIKHASTPAKKDAYQKIIDGLTKWCGRKDLQWFTPPTDIYHHSNIEISVNPEFGIFINNVPHVIKLYFKDEPLNRTKVLISTGLLNLSLATKCSAECKFAVLDIRHGKLHTYDPAVKGINSLINAEMAFISEIWDEL